MTLMILPVINWKNDRNVLTNTIIRGGFRMKDKFNDSFSVPASSLVSIPVTETVAKLLQAMFSTKIGSLELEIDEDGIDSPQLIVSCYLSNVETNKWNDLTQMYSVKQLNDYNRLRQLVYQIIDDYYALEDEQIVDKQMLKKMDEKWKYDWEDDEDAEF